MSKVRLPNREQQIVLVGRNGTGKTQAGLWHLSNKNFDKEKWVILDFKYDDHIQKIERAQEISFNDSIKYPGIYVIRPHPSQQEETNQFLWKLWEKENIGLFVDEGYMVPNPSAENSFQAILTQGRSKHIPRIILSQRPVWMSRFVFSESNFFQVFHLNDKRDLATVAAFIPRNISARLPDYHSYYYDVGRDSFRIFSPVPDEDTIMETFHEKLRPKRRGI